MFACGMSYLMLTLDKKIGIITKVFNAFKNNSLADVPLIVTVQNPVHANAFASCPIVSIKTQDRRCLIA